MYGISMIIGNDSFLLYVLLKNYGVEIEDDF